MQKVIACTAEWLPLLACGVLRVNVRQQLLHACEADMLAWRGFSKVN